MSEQIDSQVVKLWLERLRTGQEEKERAQAASELSRLRILARGAVRTRGGLTHSQPDEFPAEIRAEAMAVIRAALKDESPTVRREVAFALGEWGNEEAAEILAQFLNGPRADDSEEVRRACVSALAAIGGPTAARTLRSVAEEDASEAVRYEAIAELKELARRSRPSPAVRTRGVRTRGAPISARPGLSSEEQDLLQTLARIRDNEQEKEYLRQLAEEGLAVLQ